MADPVRTQVAIIGAGPAGLMLARLLHSAGIASIVLESRSRADVESTIRAGVLENNTVDLLVAVGSDRVLSDGQRHDGIELQFAGERHRIDFNRLVDRSVWLYAQHEVLKDLLAGLLPDGADIRFEHKADAVVDVDTETPRIFGTDSRSAPFEIIADFVVGADGSHSITRSAVLGNGTQATGTFGTATDAKGYFREYPFAWFGILCEAPTSSDELIYANSADGFALISRRSETVQRMYLQCDADLDPGSMSDSEIWDALQSRIAGVELRQGPIFQRDVLRFRSFVCRQLRRGRAYLVGDAAHTVPPTGAKGLNLAVHDVTLLYRALVSYFAGDGTDLTDRFEEVALRRIWRAQHFSWWMTGMLHTTSDATDFDRRRQIGELESVVSSTAGSTYLAEAYTGWPMEVLA